MPTDTEEGSTTPDSSVREAETASKSASDDGDGDGEEGAEPSPPRPEEYDWPNWEEEKPMVLAAVSSKANFSEAIIKSNSFYCQSRWKVLISWKDGAYNGRGEVVDCEHVDRHDDDDEKKRKHRERKPPPKGAPFPPVSVAKKKEAAAKTKASCCGKDGGVVPEEAAVIPPPDLDREVQGRERAKATIKGCFPHFHEHEIEEALNMMEGETYGLQDAVKNVQGIRCQRKAKFQ